MFRMFFFLSFFLLFITSCDTAKNQPIETIQDQKEILHQIIEDTASRKYKGQNYQSLSYGALTVYKPESFIQLDSIYRIKNKYLKNNDLRGLHQSGIEALIPEYRTAAQEEVDKVQYEIEHLYQTEANISSIQKELTIYHDYYLFNYKDSLISITPLYSFKIPSELKEFYYAYQFEFHFVDDRDLYISSAEQDFIHFFKAREYSLIGDNELQPFMDHLLKLMQTAKKAQSVNYKELTRWLILDYFSKENPNAVIEQFKPLFALDEQGINLGYEIEVEWKDEELKTTYNSIFTFSPYLEIEKTIHKKLL